MSPANMLSVLLAPVVIGLVACYFVGDRRHADPPDMPTRRRRVWIGWEVRGLVVAAAGPCAAGIFFGYLSPDYALPLMLFVIAGFLAAGLIAPSGLHVHR